MPANQPAAYRRPYLVVPKLIDQPTWGGSYIVQAKGWKDRENFGQLKIGQSYELFSGSNLSLLDTTDDPNFTGELTTSAAAALPTTPPHSIPVASVLGNQKLDLLLKFTQALGNSFQVHIKAGLKHPKWKPKPESWYYFEPGLITLGVKPGTDWAAYQTALIAVSDGMTDISRQVKSGKISHDTAQQYIKDLLQLHDPWQFVNTVATAADELVDLSAGALHHSWEEDATKAPLGNVLYELQSEAMDDISTFRGFDKGKMAKDGSVRPVHVKEYFEFIDRSAEANDPQSHVRQPRTLTSAKTHRFERLLETPFYSLDKLTFTGETGTFHDSITTFKHLFVKEGRIKVTAGGHIVTVGTGHSAFVPASVAEYQIENGSQSSQVLISY